MQDYYRAIHQDKLAQEVLAFAMYLNACTYVHYIAQNHDAPDTLLPAYISASLNTSPTSFSDLFICPETTQSALGAVIILLKGSNLQHAELYSQAHQNLFNHKHLRHIITYVHGVLKLRKNLLRSSQKLNQLQNRLHIISRFQQLQQEQDPTTTQQLTSKLAALYLDIFGTLSFRIIIQGQQEALNDPNKVEQIRSLLLGAIRFSVLWQQVGGRRWKLLIHHSKTLSKAEILYKKIQQAKSSTSSNIINPNMS